MENPAFVELIDDIEIPCSLEIIHASRIRILLIAESVLEPNFDLLEKGAFVTSVLVRPKEEIVLI